MTEPDQRSVHSEVDWEGSDGGASEPCEGPENLSPRSRAASVAAAFDMEATGALLSNATGKRRRMARKTSSPEMVPANMLALCPEPMPPSSFSTDVGSPVYVVDFGPTRPKPRSLRPLELAGYEHGRAELFCISGKEKGQTYYCACSLLQSKGAQAVLRASESLQDAYKRLPLLLSPSKPISWPGTLAEPAGDIHFRGTPITDGQSEVSPSLAKRLGILPPGAGREQPCLYGVPQFRALLPLRGGDSCLCKGMLPVDQMLDQGIRLRKECRKLHWKSSARAEGLGRNAFVNPNIVLLDRCRL